MKYIYNYVILLTLALMCVYAPVYAKDGDSCEEPIALTPEYQNTIWSASSVWYVANTFDLPMSIVFYPASTTAGDMTLYLDFGCTPGYYEDPILRGLFGKENSAYVSMPYEQKVQIGKDDAGKSCYRVEFGEFYRDMLLRQGIDYNIPVYIHAIYPCGGELTMSPDAIGNCLDGARFMHIGETVEVEPNDKESYVIVPYMQWQYDSIRYIWQGEEPCALCIGNECNFDPTDEFVALLDKKEMQPGDIYKVTSSQMMDYVNNQKTFPNEGGMYFAKIYTASKGTMKIERIPSPPPAGEAELLKYGIRSVVGRNDTSRLYAMPDSWVKDMQFYTPTNRIFRMYVGATADFETKNAIATYQFARTDEGHALKLYESDLTTLWNNKIGDSHYLYIRFECSDDTYVLPSLWSPSDCEKKMKSAKSIIQSGVEFSVTSSTTYGIYYADWKGGDMTFYWANGQSVCWTYIGDTCLVPNDSVAPAFAWGKVPKKGQGTLTFSQAQVDSWAPHVDPDGYLYLRFKSNANSKMTVTSGAPEEIDTHCPTHDSITDVVEWDSYEWRGGVYTVSGTYHEDGTMDPETECLDSTFTLNLQILKTTYDTCEETGCDSIIYHNKKYTKSGEYKDTVRVSGVSRIITTLTLTINHATTGEEFATVLPTQLPYAWHGISCGEAGDYHDTLTNSVQCDSVVTLHLTVSDVLTGDTTATACESFEWYGETYTKSGEYQHTLTNAAGIDSTVMLHLTINYPTESVDTTTVCDSLFWNGEWRKESREYTFVTTNAAGCDSTAILRLTVNKSYYITLPDTQACESFQWGDTTIFDTGTYTRHLQTASGCDSVVMMYISVGKEDYTNDYVTAYDSYTWIDGNTYTSSESGRPYYLTNQAGCDSIVTLYLTIRHMHRDTTPMALCASELPYNWYGKNIEGGGTYYSDTLQGVETDTVHTLVLTVNPTYAVDTFASVCDTEYTWHGILCYQTDDYIDTMQTVAGCDSVVTLHLTFLSPSFGDTIDVTVCPALLPYEWHGISCAGAGDYNDTLQSVAGCDSIVTLHLIVAETSVSYEYDTVCPDQLPYLWHDIACASAGNYTDTLQSVAGCDSVVTLHLIVAETSVSYEYDTVCPAQLPYEWHDSIYTEAGDYNDTLQTVAGCDSIVTLHLIVAETSVSYEYDTVCPAQLPYLWHGNISCPEAGDYDDTLQTVAGCDSIVTLHLIVAETSVSYEYDTVCPAQLPYLWHGNISCPEAGDYDDTLQTVAGCDSVVTLHLTVSEILTSDSFVTVCPGQLPYAWHGISCAQPDDYNDTLQTVAGCDSIVTLHLTVSDALTSDTTVTVCPGQLPYEWHGISCAQPDDYSDTLQSVAGCDSIVTLHLTVSDALTGDTIAAACSLFEWHGTLYTASGNYKDTLLSADGCDSIVTLHLTIDQHCAEYDTVYFCKGFNTEHEERVSGDSIRRYLPYTFESPNTWDYMEGVIVAGEPTRTLVDFHRAEANLHAHYMHGLTPVERIIWSVRYEEKGPYIPLEINDEEPLWISAGMLAVQVQFRCGEIFNTAFPTALGEVDAVSQAPLKRIENGQLIILRGDAVYTPMGQKIK